MSNFEILTRDPSFDPGSWDQLVQVRGMLFALAFPDHESIAALSEVAREHGFDSEVLDEAGWRYYTFEIAPSLAI